MSRPTDDLDEFKIIWCVALMLVVIAAIWAV